MTAAGNWLTADGRGAVGELVAVGARWVDPYITPAALQGHGRADL
ncbi:hypothetical protein AB4212_02140 [Streptomyces sp. 2MCAF27]